MAQAESNLVCVALQDHDLRDFPINHHPNPAMRDTRGEFKRKIPLDIHRRSLGPAPD
jgi:hypothetical protein